MDPQQDWPDALTLRAPKALDGAVRPPGSKSLSNRALLCAALAPEASELRGGLHSEDTEVMRAALSAFGRPVVESEEGGWRVPARGSEQPSRSTPLYVATAGTAARFLAPALAAGLLDPPTDNANLKASDPPRAWVMDGSERMRERPMGELLEALRKLGAQIEDRGASGFLPIAIHPRRLRGGEIVLPRPASSQFVSGLIFAGLGAREALEIDLPAGTPAQPYVDMTLDTIRDFGGEAGWLERGRRLRVEPGILHGRNYEIEPDASGASYFLCLAAIHGGRIRIEELDERSQQGDAQFARVLESMGAHVEYGQGFVELRAEAGALRGLTINLSDMPDMTLSLAACAAVATGPTKIRGVEVLRHHESDRIASGATELRKLGVEVHEHKDGLDIHPPARLRSDAVIDTYRDHRVAMAFSTLAPITIRAPKVVDKTYPSFFHELAGLGMLDEAPGPRRA